MRIYKYSKDTKEYLGYMEANIDPLESLAQGKDVFVIPPYFTSIRPDLPSEGNTMVFDGTKWEEVEDHRGLKVYDKKSGKEEVVKELGPIPSTCQLEKPVFLEELRISKTKELEVLVDHLRREECVINGVKSSVETWTELVQKLGAFDLFSSITIEDVVVTKEELEEAIKYFYIRSFLIAEKKSELLKEINSIRGKKKILNVDLNMNLDGEIQELMKLSKEELNERFKK